MSTNTWNPAAAHPQVVFSNGNLTAVCTDSIIHGVLSFPFTAGKKEYWEVKQEGQFTIIGVAANSFNYNDINSMYTGYYSSDGKKYPDVVAFGASYNSGDVIGLSFDGATGGIWVRKNGVFQGAGSPSTAPNSPMGFVNVASGPYKALVNFQGFGGSIPKVTANFGATAFRDAPPAGFTASSVGINSGGPLAMGGDMFCTSTMDGALGKVTKLGGDMTCASSMGAYPGMIKRFTGLLTSAASMWANIISTLPSKLFITAATSHCDLYTATTSEMVS